MKYIATTTSLAHSRGDAQSYRAMACLAMHVVWGLQHLTVLYGPYHLSSLFPSHWYSFFEWHLEFRFDWHMTLVSFHSRLSPFCRLHRFIPLCLLMVQHCAQRYPKCSNWNSRPTFYYCLAVLQFYSKLRIYIYTHTHTHTHILSMAN